MIIRNLYRIDFDNLENRAGNALSSTHVATFTTDGKLTAHGHAGKYIATLTIRPYLGWDGEIYPKFELSPEVIVNPPPPP